MRAGEFIVPAINISPAKTFLWVKATREFPANLRGVFLMGTDLFNEEERLFHKR